MLKYECEIIYACVAKKIEGIFQRDNFLCQRDPKPILVNLLCKSSNILKHKYYILNTKDACMHFFMVIHCALSNEFLLLILFLHNSKKAIIDLRKPNSRRKLIAGFDVIIKRTIFWITIILLSLMTNLRLRLNVHVLWIEPLPIAHEHCRCP